MKKRLLIWGILLALTLPWIAIAGDAAHVPAVTRQQTIELEGMPEVIDTQLFVSDLGYSMWFDPEFLSLLPQGEDLSVDTFAWAYSENVLSIHKVGAADPTVEAVLADLAQQGYAPEAFDAADLLPAYTVQGIRGLKDGDIRILYALQTGESTYYITTTYNQEAAEGLGPRLRYMLESFQAPAEILSEAPQT